ncbi:RNA polymerase sigma-70 factor [Flagellimonas olearia]|uniref:RNA polymerase sigma-70 factor n=1 Tax=Flagellimonas olearia TaxID=552546 RepID=A0A6I1E2N7_9FLAO|nr:RNA polymerase sigma-70 factor [Allomuricauda olearia]KAB7530221.1 RNA polymerase sigma-70 factor [Allomuricauda olearia]
MKEEKALLARLKSGDEKAFELIYDLMAGRLYNYCNSRINHREVSEGIVQEVFISLWQKRTDLTITSSLESYLFGSAKYQILNHIRSEKVRRIYANKLGGYLLKNFENPTEDFMAMKDFSFLIDEIVGSLPPKCQKVFKMSRYEHLSIQEISIKMQISTRTVENHITKALSHIRKELKPLLGLALLWL